MEEVVPTRISKGLIFFRDMLWKEINALNIIKNPYVLRYKIDMAWFLLPPGKRRIYEVEAALINDPNSPVLNPLYYQQDDGEYLKFVHDQSRTVKNPYEVFSELGYDPLNGFDYEKKKRMPSNQQGYTSACAENSDEPINLVKKVENKPKDKEVPTQNLVGQETISLRQGGFLYFVETCRLNFSFLGGNVLRFNDNCWKAWSVLSEEMKDQFQATAEFELNTFMYTSGANTVFPMSIKDLYLKDLKFSQNKYETLILQRPNRRNTAASSHTSVVNGAVKNKTTNSEVPRRRKRGNPQGLLSKWSLMTSKEKRLCQRKMETSVQDYLLDDVVKNRNNNNPRPRKDPNAPKKPMTSYLYFVSEYRRLIRQMNPGLSFSEISQILGIQWKTMSENDKGVFYSKALQDKHRYDREMLQYAQQSKTGSHYNSIAPKHASSSPSSEIKPTTTTATTSTNSPSHS